MIHLHTRSCYSLLEGCLTSPNIVRLAKENGQSAAVLTDHRSMFGTMEFVHACKKEGLRPVIGLELEIEDQQTLHPLILLAKNTRGLQNLFKLSTRLMSEEAILDLSSLSECGQDLIVLTGIKDEFLKNAFEHDLTDEISGYFQRLQEHAESVYFGLSLQEASVWRNANALISDLAASLGIRSAALAGIYYEKEEDEETLRLLQAIASRKNIDDPSIRVLKNRFYRDAANMEKLYPLDALEAADQIISQIEEYKLPEASLPVFHNHLGVSSDEFLTRLCQAGLKKRLNGKVPEAYAQRLSHELNIIISMGFSDYFLIVYDFIREARSRGILVGPGRGSAAGSAAAWCLGISHVDPLKNGLLFERFLNPERISMPDIDTDFPDNRRDEVIEYVHQKYGSLHAAHIVTFARMKARLALRDAARALGIRERDTEKLVKLIPSNPQLDPKLAEVYQSNARFRQTVDQSPSLSRLYHLALRIEGLPRHASVHAGGIVLSRDSILNQAPLAKAGASLPAVQFTMEYLEELGLIKFDFLALRNLTMLDQMRQAVERKQGRPFDLLRLPLDDPAVYDLLCKGDTLGIFQLESSGIRSLIDRYQPRRFEDIAAILALYRPGPMKNISLFLSWRKQGGKAVSIHPLLDPILAETGGIFLYQEQIMEASRAIGGFTLAQADTLRKAMSKKQRGVMESWREKFIEGAAKRKIDQETAASIFATMEQFADYGFNKSHSYAYGLIVYQMAWIKAREPAIFYASALNGSMGSPSKTAAFLQEMRIRRLSFRSPDLNLSKLDYTLQQQTLILPFGLIKGLGSAAASGIVAEREARGPFKDPVEAIVRLARARITRAQIQNLIEAGALDSIEPSRESLLSSFDRIWPLIGLVEQNEDGSLDFSCVSYPELAREPMDLIRRLEGEKNVFGFYLSRHPAARLRQKNPKLLDTARAVSLSGWMETAGIIENVKEIRTKKGDPMAFVTISDDTGQIDAAVMPGLYETVRPVLLQGTLIVIEGNKDKPKSILARRILPVDPSSL